MSSYDALVLGGGFYGVQIALMLRRQGLQRVMVVEREDALLTRASFVNQARVHHGYHYPRSLSTADRSARNYVRFVSDFGDAVHRDMKHLYAIARGSHVSPEQFKQLCRRIGAPYRTPPPSSLRLFDPELIQAAFLVEELAFDARRMAHRLDRELREAQVEVVLGRSAIIRQGAEDSVAVSVGDELLHAKWAFNCTYANLEESGPPLRTVVKLEAAEIALIDPPSELKGFGVTVMDGPFFSTMPFPALGAHSLTHVRYTPHAAHDRARISDVPTPEITRASAMVRSAARYLPAMARSKILGSIFEVKAVLQRNEHDDGRPILIEQSAENRRVFSILGGKIDNIYDVFEYFSSFEWSQ